MNAVVNPNVMERLLKTAPVSHHAVAAPKIIKMKASLSVNAASAVSALLSIRNTIVSQSANVLLTIRNVIVS